MDLHCPKPESKIQKDLREKMATLGPEFVISYVLKKEYKEKVKAMEEEMGAEKRDFGEEKCPKKKASIVGWMKKKVHPTKDSSQLRNEF